MYSNYVNTRDIVMNYSIRDIVMNYIITQEGKLLDESKYSIDLDTKTFNTKENYLVLDFNYLGGWTFNTGFRCTFKTGHSCTFNTGNHCTFLTGFRCTFHTGSYCTFTTGEDCTFTTGGGCTFATGDECNFTVGEGCIFKTGKLCTFKTGNECMFMLWDINTCKFKTYDGMSIILDRSDNKAYKLTKELIDIQKVIHG